MQGLVKTGKEKHLTNPVFLSIQAIESLLAYGKIAFCMSHSHEAQVPQVNLKKPAFNGCFSISG